MKKRQKLGQHFLTSNKIAQLIVDSAKLTKNEIVMEIGTGKGILTPLLCQKAKKVISIEADKELFGEAKSKFSQIENLELIQGDGFKIDKEFDVFVSNLPYSKSRAAIEWLIQRNFQRAIVMVQKEFAEKLLSKEMKRGISVLANHGLLIESIMNVSKKNFNPQPKIDSVVLTLARKQSVSKSLIETVNKLFSYKRKTIKNIYKEFGKTVTSDKRLEDLTVEEIIKIANQLEK